MNERYGQKLRRLVTSRRWQVAICAVIAITCHELLGLDEQEVRYIVQVAIVWIAGDTIRAT
jgi:hypothetical protein